MDTTDYDWLASLIDYYGRGKALEYAGKLAKQQLNLRRGPTLLAQLAVAGEFPIVIDAFPEEIMQMRNAKAPVDFIFSEPFVAVKTPTTVSIAVRRAASPRGGAVRGFSAFQARARPDGRPRALGEPKRRQLLRRPEGQENADSDGRMGRQAGGADQTLQFDLCLELVGHGIRGGLRGPSR